MIEAVSSVTLGDGIVALTGLRGVGRATPARPTAAVQPAPLVVRGPGGTCSDGGCDQDMAEISDEARRLADQMAFSSAEAQSDPTSTARQPGGLLDVTA